MLIKLSEYNPNFSLFERDSMTSYYKYTFLGFSGSNGF